MKNKHLIRLLCVTVLSQYALMPGAAFAQGNEETTAATSETQGTNQDTTAIDDSLVAPFTDSLTEPQTATNATEESTESSAAPAVEAETAKTLSWEWKQPDQSISAGDDFTLKMKGTQAVATIVLPEGIAYDALKNNEALRSAMTFNDTTRELTITAIDQHEEVELVLTAEKAGAYELQMKNEKQEIIGDKLSFNVTEKVSEEAVQEAVQTTNPETAVPETTVPETTEQATLKEASKTTRASDSRVKLSTSSDPKTEITTSSERIVYATTMSHTDSTTPIDGGKLVFTIENGTFNSYPTAAEHADTLKSAVLSADGKTITLVLKDGLTSGNFTSYTYSAYAAVGIEAGAEISVKTTFTGQFRGESTAFTNEDEKVIQANLPGGGVKPVTPQTSSWELTGPDATLYPGVTTTGYPRLKSLNTEQGFTNLKIKLHYSDSTKISWSTALTTTYTIYYKTGETKTIRMNSETLEKVDEQTYIMTIGEVNPDQIDSITFTSTQVVPKDAVSGESFKITMTAMEADTPILSRELSYTVSTPRTTINFKAKTSGEIELLPGQNFTTSYTTTGLTTEKVDDYQVTIDVPNEVVPKKVLNGIISGSTPNIGSLEIFTNSTWVSVPKNGDGDFDIPDGTITQLRINYTTLNGTILNYQPFRVEWQVKENVPDETNVILKNHFSYTDYLGILQTPNVSTNDLSYVVKSNARQTPTQAVVYQNNKTKDFSEGSILAGDTFRMNYRLGNKQGELEQPYIFIKLPKGIEVKNMANVIQYPYANDISYPSSPSNGKTVTPISKANNVGSFEAADGSMVYYYKADDTNLVQSDFIQMLLIDNQYTVKNVESGIYEIEVGMGSLKENYENVTLNSGYEKSSLPTELQTKLGAQATTYYSKKTKMTVGKVDKVTTGVSVKGSEDTKWLDASQIGKVVPGKKVSYRVTVKNEGTENYSNVQLINILPYVGDTLVSSSTARNSQFQINPDSSGISVTYNGQETKDVTLEYSTSNNPVRFSSPNGEAIGADGWVSAVSDYSKVRAIRVGASAMTLKPGDEITLEYSAVVVLDAKRPQNNTETFKANNSVAYRFETADGEARAGEPSVSTVETTKAEADGVISGNAYIDLDKNGSKASAEPGLNQVTFELYKQDTSGQFVSTGVTSESSSNSTGENGIFGFTDLGYGTYKVKVKLPNTKGAEFITTGTDKLEKIDATSAWVMQNDKTEFVLNDSSELSHEIKNLQVPIFVNTPLTGSINFKNKAGTVVNSDYGKGFTVDLYQGSSKVATTTSGNSGIYSFEGLVIDSKAAYTLKFTSPSGKQYAYTSGNSNGELLINLEPGIGTTDLTDIYITDTDLPTAKVAVVNGHGLTKDVNPSSVNLTAADATTAVSTFWKIIQNGVVEYSGTSTEGTTSLQSQLNYLIGDKKAGDYTVNMVVTDFAGNQATASEDFSIKFGTVKYMNGTTEHAKQEKVLLYVDKLDQPTPPTKTGYIFDKWVKADNTAWDFAEDTLSEENLELTATFKAEEQLVTFDVNGGDAASQPADIEASTNEVVDLSKVKTPTREGYTFKHWYLKDDANKTAVGTSVKVPAGGLTLVAEWEAISYKVAFDNNGGTGAMSTMNFTYDAVQNLTKNTFTKAGYSFAGWSTKADGSAVYTDGASVNNLTADADKTVTLYAIWQADEQTITFDVNGGDIASKPADIVEGTDEVVDLSKVKAPSRTGYTFKHWYLQGDSSKKDVGTSVKMPAGGLTLIAEWEANDYTIAFDNNGGTGSMAVMSLKYDTPQNLTTNSFTKAGYSFVGWSTKADGSAVYTDSASVNNLTADADKTVILYAIWQAEGQTVTFDVNGGDTSSKPTDIKDVTDAIVDLSKVKAPSRAGYTFKHWYVKGDTDKTAVGTSIKVPVGGVTLVAEWEANNYTVVFNSNSGTGTMTAMNFKYDLAQDLTANKFTKAGYSFAGWSTKATGPAEYVDGASVKNLTDQADGVYTLYAIWTTEEQAIHFDVNGGDISTKPADIVEDTDEVVDLSKVKAPTRTGYIFQHWYLQGDTDKKDVGTSVKMPAGGLTLVAEWKANSYKVAFDNNGGTGTMAAMNFKYDTAQALTKNTFTKAGYSFAGWSTKADSSVVYTDAASVNNLTETEDETVILYAIWQAEQQTITFDVNGGDTASKPADIKEDTDETVDLSNVAAPTRTGYTFKHWYLQGDIDKKDVGTSVKMPAGGLILVAEWEARDYTVKFNANGGHEIMADQPFIYDQEQALTANTFVREGYTFAGWSSTETGSVEYRDQASVKNLTSKAKGTFELFAIWIAEDQTIHFDPNGGDEVSAPKDIVSKTDSEVDLSTVKVPERTGYTFDHWYKQGDASENEVSGKITVPAGGLTLVASWKANKYIVNFDANGAEGDMNAQEFVYDEEQSLSANQFEKTNYNFVGWSTEKEDVAEYADQAAVKNLEEKNNGIVILYAIWEKKPAVPVLSAKDVILTTDQVVGFLQEGMLDEKIAELSEAKVIDENTNELLASHETLTVDTSAVKSDEGVYQATISYPTKTRAAVTTKTIDVTVVEPVNIQKITFDVNGGDINTQPAEISAQVGTSVSLKDVKNPTRADYAFVGWYDGAKKVGTTVEMPENGLKLVAKWEKINTDEKSASDTTNSSKTSTDSKKSGKQTLPKANSENAVGLSVLGVILALIPFTFFKKKRDEETE